MLSERERSRYSRHLLLPEIGVAGQEKLKSARVLVIGAGGLGSPASLYLAAAGIGTLGIADHDRVEFSNLQRQVLFDDADVGMPKAAAAQVRLQALNPDIRVQAHELAVGADNALAVLRDYDLVLDGTDRLASRYLINDACVLLGLPLVTAAVHRFEGQAMTYVPGRSPCYRCLFPQADASAAPGCAEAGVLGVLPGLLGALQATEAIKLITGVGTPLAGRLLTFDALAMQWREFAFARRSDCAVCGEQPTIRTLSESAASVLDNSSAGIDQLTPRALAALIARADTAGAAVALVDVREPAEFGAAHLPGAMNIPLSDLPRRLPDIPLHFRLVFICRSGTRSLAAGAVALRSGRSAVAHLEGGMQAWAAGNPT
jgi:adenylyltransferase/sulfurtransferase